MNIQRTVAQQIALYRFDEIPFGRLASNVAADRFLKLFEFKTAEAVPDAAGKLNFQFQAGSFRDGADVFPISRLNIEERRIVLIIEGHSEDATRALAKIRAFFAEIAERVDPEYLQPILIAEESEIVARLDFTVERLMAPELLHVARLAQGVFNYRGIATAKTNPSQAVFTVDYQMQDTALIEQQISIIRKEFSIALRVGTLIADQIYYSKAPINTTEHIHLLEELERSLTA